MTPLNFWRFVSALVMVTGGLPIASGAETSPQGRLSQNRTLAAGTFVQKIVFDSRGDAWLGTFKEGVWKWDGRQLMCYDPTNSAFPKAVVWDLAADRTNGVWAATGAGLVRIDAAGVRSWNSRNSPMPCDYVSSVAVDSSNRVWGACSVSTQSAVVRFNGLDWTVYSPIALKTSFNLVRRVAADAQGNVWAGLMSHVGGCQLVHFRGNEWELIKPTTSDPAIYSFGQMKAWAGRLVFSIDYGSSSFSGGPTDPQLVQCEGTRLREINLPSGMTTSLAEVIDLAFDAAGTLWGISEHSLWNRNGARWKIYPLPKLPGAVSCFAFDQQGRVWIGTVNGVVICDEPRR